MEKENKYRILLVEDDANLGNLLCEYLNAKNFETELAKDGAKGFEAFRKKEFDLCLLDVMMPQKDGFTLAREIREANSKIPIIFLTAKSMKEDTIAGFKSGGDDYISKPFSMEELLYRIRAILRRTNSEQPTEQHVYSIGHYRFDSNSQELKSGDGVQRLTSKESQLLKLLCENRNQTLNRETALKLIWGDDTYFNARSMDVYVSKLRKYFRKDEGVEIVNIHGKGFKLLDNL